MPQLIAVLIPLLLLAFWAWMYSNMAGNEDLPNCFITVSAGGNPRLDWNVAFILLNIVTAAYYYASVYRYRH